MNNRIFYYLQEQNTPYFNLALEEFLFYEKQSHEYVLVYKNGPSIIMGNFQNPFSEINFAQPMTSEVNIVRRFSGGGTVFHDLGNLNISFISNRPDKQVAQLEILDFLKSHFEELKNVDFELSSMGDMLIKHNQQLYKFSGSGYRQSKNRFLHHFTLLIDADLKSLKHTLSSTFFSMNSKKGVKSRPTKVMNLSQLGIKQNHFENRLREYLSKTSHVVVFDQKIKSDFETKPTFNQLIKKNQSFSFLYEKCCDFLFTEEIDSELVVEGEVIKGSLQRLSCSGSANFLQRSLSLKTSNQQLAMEMVPSQIRKKFTGQINQLLSKLFVYRD